MSTRCAIIMKDGDGYRGIYSHWDGYIEEPGAGSILHEHYRDEAKVKALIDLGDISQLGAEVVPTGPHSYESPQEGVTVAYGRDGGETDVDPTTGKTVQEVEDRIGHNGYVYVWEDGTWHVNGDLLSEALGEQEPSQDPVDTMIEAMLPGDGTENTP